MTLDELAQEFPCGTMVLYKTGNPDVNHRGMVVGVCFSLPKTKGGPMEPALVTERNDYGLGNVYPEEVLRRYP